MLNPRKIKHLQEDQQLKEEQKMNITYHEENGYLLPNIVVGCDTSRPIGKYGWMRRKVSTGTAPNFVQRHGSGRHAV